MWKCGRVRFIATVLKTVVSKGTVSSNLTVSAKIQMRIEQTISLRDVYYDRPRTTNYITLIDDQTHKKYHHTLVILGVVTYTNRAQMEHYQPKGTQLDLSL